MSFEALRALIIASGYELRFRENEWVECLMLRDGEAWLGRGRDRTSALHRALHLACPSSLARDLLTSRVEHLMAEAAAASAEHREKVLDAIANEAPDSPPSAYVDPLPAPPVPMPRAPMQTSIPARDDLRPYPASAASAALPGTEDLRAYPATAAAAASSPGTDSIRSYPPAAAANAPGGDSIRSYPPAAAANAPGGDSIRSYSALHADPRVFPLSSPAPAAIDPLRAYPASAGSVGASADLLRAYPGVTAPTKSAPLSALNDAEARAARVTPFFDRPRATPRAYNVPPPLVRREVSTPRVVDPPRALEELDILLERIRDSRDELGLCSPERQRLAMLAWICEGRAHTDTFPDDLRIRERVGSISRQLTEIGKTFWPGSVTALQLQMQPRDLPRHVLGGAAPTWSRAAELSERALHALEYSDERRGFDAYGWADLGHALPLPENPTELMEQIIREVENCGGPLLPHAAPRDGDSRPDSASYTRWVRTLRWLRASDVDPDRWGRLAGRLRWWATHRDPQHAVGARELEASYAPEHPWAHELGMPLPIDGLLGHEGADGATNGKVVNDLLDTVRGMTSGKRLVFVSNRRDPDLELRLKDLLPEAALEWRVAEPKRIETLGESIQQGAFDVVLAAIGFQSLATDHLLARACRLARVKYLRVNRGRPNACIRALARP